MTHTPRILALIPARGGSRAVPGKNVRPVGGRPLIAWTIAAAKAAHCIDRVVVSTDDERIAEVSRAAGAEVPWLRPRELATDDSPAIESILHALGALAADDYSPDFIALLQPTSPLRTAKDIDDASALQHRTGATSVVSVAPVTQRPEWCRRLSSDGELLAATEEDPRARQHLEPLVVLNGAIYLVQTAHVLQSGSLYADRTMALVMPPERSIDIDTWWDLHLADLALRFPMRAAE